MSVLLLAMFGTSWSHAATSWSPGGRGSSGGGGPGTPDNSIVNIASRRGYSILLITPSPSLLGRAGGTREPRDY